MDLILVGIGGAAGSLCRFELARLMAGKSTTAFPFGTFIINITGAILLGIVIGINPGNNAYLLLGDGFLGAFTTFSTFMYEGFNLFADNKRRSAFAYIAITLLLGVLGFGLGFGLVKFFL